MYNRGVAMGQEHKGKGIDIQLGPVAGPIGRAPAAGRNWEGFSPDPVLTGVGMAETIKGMQDMGIIATAKHYVGNEQGNFCPCLFVVIKGPDTLLTYHTEHFRQASEAQGYGYNITESISSNIDDKTLHELYVWPFADAVRAGVGAIMCSYNQINNSYACQNSKMLNNILKGELGFQGFVMSDWSAQHTGVATAVAGLDMSMPGDVGFDSGTSYWGSNLTVAVLNGTLPLYRLDDMAMRIMASFFKVGLTLNEPEPNFSSWTRDTYNYVHAYAQKGWEQVNQHIDVRGEHASLIREIGAKGTVLLKNNGILPLKKPKFLAVIGEDAGPNLYGPNGCAAGDHGCDNGTLAMGWGSGTADFPYLVTPDAALQYQALSDGTRYESILDNYAWSQIKALVNQAESTAIVFANADSGEGYINIDGNEGDRKNLTLWNAGDELIKNVSSLNNNTIVVIHSVGPTLLTDWYDHPNISAIIWAGLPGQESGNSLVDVLYGNVNPAGRTPFTWGTTRESYGTDVMYEPNNGNGAPQDDFSEGVFIDYRYFDKTNATPIYEFGFGLSYTTFSYANLQIQKAPASNYTATTGFSAAAPIIGGNFSTNIAEYAFPSGQFDYIEAYIYPYLNSTASLEAASNDSSYGQTAAEFLPPNAVSSAPIPLLPASGAPGGHPALWDVLYTVTADITNTGALAGDEVPQLYVSLGGPEDPPVVLRGFDRLSVAAGETVTFEAQLTRRDLSNWDTLSQNWVISTYPKKVFVGRSSRKLELSATLS